MLKRLLPLCVFFALFLAEANAQGYGYPGAGPYAGGPRYPAFPDYQKSDPVTLLEDGLERMRTFFGSGNPDKAAIYLFLTEQVAPYFDFTRMAEWVTRPYYRRMSPAERAQFQARLQETFFRALARELGIFSNPQPQVDFFRPRRTGPNTLSVNARVMPVNARPIRLTFKLYLGSDGWKIYDVASNGISAVQYYRQQFIHQVRRDLQERQ